MTMTATDLGPGQTKARSRDSEAQTLNLNLKVCNLKPKPSNRALKLQTPSNTLQRLDWMKAVLATEKDASKGVVLFELASLLRPFAGSSSAAT